MKNLILSAVVIGLFAMSNLFATQIEVAEGEDVISAAVATAAAGDSIVLTTSGGLYTQTERIDNAAAICVMAKEGLADKPIVRSAGADYPFKIYNSAILKGIIIDANNIDVMNGGDYGMYTKVTDNVNGYLIIDDCVFINANRAIYSSSSFNASQISITNTTFKNCIMEGIRFKTKKKAATKINIENCTFDSTGVGNSEGYGIWIKTYDSGDDPEITIDHVTMYATGTPSIRIQPIDSATISAEIKNIIVQASDSLACEVTGANVSVHDFLYFGSMTGGGIEVDGGTTSNIHAEVDPKFSDAEAGNFSLQVGSPAIGSADDSKNLGDTRWGVATSVAEINSIPNNFKLNQNYPNPFNPTTTIKYYAQKAGNVKITVYNTLGQAVKVLVNNNVSAGQHSVIFNASDLASGVYIYQMQAADFSSYKKMILMK